MKRKLEEGKVFCNLCGREIVPGNDEDGLPNGVGFLTMDGGVINVCRDCIIQRGKEMDQDV